MVLKREAAAYRAWKEGVVHTTLNPKGPGAVRIHLIPPKYRPFGKNPYAMILNGYYILPLGYSWAVLLGNFIREVNRFDGRPMDEKDMEKVVTAAVERTGKSYRVPEEQLRGDLEEMLAMLYGVACGEEPSGEIEPLSLREYAPRMTAPHRMDLMVSAMTKADGGWNCNLQCRHCYAAGQPEAEGKELNTEQWKKIIDRLKIAGVPQVTFTGGEPTLRRDLAELVEYSRWFVTRLNTNGILLTPDLCRELYEASLDSVQITLYSWNGSIHSGIFKRTGGPVCHLLRADRDRQRLLRRLSLQPVVRQGDGRDSDSGGGNLPGNGDGDRFYVTRPGGGEAFKAAGNTGAHVRRLSVQHGRDTRRAGCSVSELAGRCGSGGYEKRFLEKHLEPCNVQENPGHGGRGKPVLPAPNREIRKGW